MTDKIELNDKAYEDIKVGDKFSFNKFVDEKMVASFAEFTGDSNPLHTDVEYAKTTEFGGTIVHGMSLASLFSTLVGMLCPGKKALYLSQDIQFKNPLYPNKTVTVSGEVIAKLDALKIIEIKTAITDEDNNTLVSGKAKAKVIEQKNETGK